MAGRSLNSNALARIDFRGDFVEEGNGDENEMMAGFVRDCPSRHQEVKRGSTKPW